MKIGTVERNKILLPFELTSRLVDEILNLKIKPQINRIDIEQLSRRIPKDKFSALEYGLWRIKEFEDKFYKARRRGTRKVSDLMSYTPSKKTQERNKRKGSARKRRNKHTRR